MELVNESDRDPLVAAVDMFAAGLAALQAAPCDGLTHPELLAQLDRIKTVSWALPAVEHRLTARLAAEADPTALGATSLVNVLATTMRITAREAHRRLQEAAQLGPRRALTGAALAPQLTVTAAAQARGAIGPDHVRIIRTALRQLPGWVDPTTRAQIEDTLGRIAADLAPDQLRLAADRLAVMLDQDGDEFHDAERARRRYLSIGRQRADGMTEITGLLDPQARAALDAVLAKWAAPGMCNPDDESPCVDGQPGQQRAERDPRSQNQRHHDALTALCRAMLASGQLGHHNGLPATIIISTTLQDLQSGTGHAVTGGGTLLPMREVIRQAAHAHHYLTVFDGHTHETLYLARAKRCATPGQRIVLHATDRGCSFPTCPVPGYGCQAHHAVRDWAHGGQTNIDDLTFACGPHNRLVTDGGWKTRKRQDGRTEWLPPPHLDTGQARINHYHHPERYLTYPDDDDGP